MEQIIKCKSLVAIYQGDKLLLDGPHILEFNTIRNQPFHIKIEQLGVRTIIITSGKDVSVFDLYAILTRIERLLMLFDGVFIPLSELKFSESDTVDENRLISCQNNLIKMRLSYGVDIFSRELSSDYESILQIMVNSRIKIMHIKRKQNGLYFNGNESILYILKMNLLYRKIMFEMLNIEEVNYKDNLLRCVSRLDKWSSVLEKFLLKISK